MARVGGKSMKVPYYYERKGRAYWEPRGKVPAGFAARPLGPAGEDARMYAARLYNAMWQARRGGAGGEQDNRPKWPKGTVGEAWEAYRRTVEWTKKQPRTREAWDRVWVRLSPIFGDVKPSTITLIDVSAWRAGIETTVSQREAHRCIKIWRALWQVMAALKYCDADNDPSFGVGNTEPAPRALEWQQWEITRIGKRAWREGYKGLAAILAVMWDEMMSPVDPRTLMDIRRSGALEASAGEVDPKALSDVMGNTISESKALQRTYTPAQIATAAKVPEARRKGRRARAANESGS
jgi:hypothetical protein